MIGICILWKDNASKSDEDSLFANRDPDKLGARTALDLAGQRLDVPRLKLLCRHVHGNEGVCDFGRCRGAVENGKDGAARLGGHAREIPSQVLGRSICRPSIGDILADVFGQIVDLVESCFEAALFGSVLEGSVDEEVVWAWRCVLRRIAHYQTAEEEELVIIGEQGTINIIREWFFLFIFNQETRDVGIRGKGKAQVVAKNDALVGSY